MRSVCQSVLVKRLQQIHYHPTARFTCVAGWSERRRGRGPRARPRTMLPQFVRATKESRELVWISEHVFSSHIKVGLYTPLHHHSSHPSSSPPPPSSSDPTINRKRRGRKKLAYSERNCARTFLFAARRRHGKVGSLPLPHPSLLSVMCVEHARALHIAAVARLMQARRVAAAILKSSPHRTRLGHFLRGTYIYSPQHHEHGPRCFFSRCLGRFLHTRGGVWVAL